MAFHSRLSLILCLLLSCQPPAFALKEPARDSARGGGARPAAAAVSIPENLGAVRERYEANSGGRTVILIEDAHADPAAQENIRRILRHLQTQHSLKWVGVEGASGRIDRSFFRTFPDQDLLEDVILGYVRGGELSGAAAAAILDPPETLFTGLEDWGLYERALEIYLQVKASPARSTVNFTDLSRKSSAHLLKPAEQSESSATKIRLEHLIKKTLQLDLSRKEWEEFKSTMASKETWLHTFPDFERISTELHPYIRFFQIAEERDEIFLKRALSLMEISRQQNAVVVCGRFHSEGMAQQLRASGISYMVITPHGTGGANEGLRYSRLLRGEVSWNHYFSTENGYVDLYEAFAQALRDKLLKAAGPKAAARILRVWRARLSQSAAPPGITERNNPLLSMPSYEQEPLPLHREWLLNIDSFIEHSAKLPGGRSHLQPAVMIPLGSDKLRSNLLVQIPLKQSEELPIRFESTSSKKNAASVVLSTAPYPENLVYVPPERTARTIHAAPGFFGLFNLEIYPELEVLTSNCARECASAAFLIRKNGKYYAGLGHFTIEPQDPRELSRRLRLFLDYLDRRAGIQDSDILKIFVTVPPDAEESGLSGLLKDSGRPSRIIPVQRKSWAPAQIRASIHLKEPKSGADAGVPDISVSWDLVNREKFESSLSGESRDIRKFEPWENLNQALYGVRSGWLLAFDVDRTGQQKDIPAVLNQINTLLLESFPYQGIRFFGSYKTLRFKEKEEGFILIPQALPEEAVTKAMEAARQRVAEEAPTTVMLAALDLGALSGNRKQLPESWVLENRLVRMLLQGKRSGRNRIVMQEPDSEESRGLKFDELTLLSRIKSVTNLADRFQIIEKEIFSGGTVLVSVWGQIRAKFTIKADPAGRDKDSRIGVHLWQPLNLYEGQTRDTDSAAYLQLCRMLLGYLKSIGFQTADLTFQKRSDYELLAKGLTKGTEAPKSRTLPSSEIPALEIDLSEAVLETESDIPYRDEDSGQGKRAAEKDRFKLRSSNSLAKLALLLSPASNRAALFGIPENELEELLAQYRAQPDLLRQHLGEQAEAMLQAASREVLRELRTALPETQRKFMLGLMLPDSSVSAAAALPVFLGGYTAALDAKWVESLLLNTDHFPPALGSKAAENGIQTAAYAASGETPVAESAAAAGLTLLDLSEGTSQPPAGAFQIISLSAPSGNENRIMLRWLGMLTLYLQIRLADSAQVQTHPSQFSLRELLQPFGLESYTRLLFYTGARNPYRWLLDYGQAREAFVGKLLQEIWKQQGL